MKTVLGFIGALVAIVVTLVFVGFAVTYVLIFLNFSGSESVVETCFEIGFGRGFVCALVTGFIMFRHLWIKYSSSDPE